ncbi:mitogen-activated protein kinase kinase kinase NPK1-like [Curcuma longa]|uniref:mitogen-activated protein kinase kinase kinase NPK1-like n=1 Tax=Curcuma longa TaxID=136217 RepID=UPI003D9FA037
MTMHDLFGSVRRSLAFRTDSDGNGGVGSGRIAEKIGSCLRKSRIGLGLGFGGFAPKLPPPTPSEEKDNAPPIRWRKGELIGCGAFGHVFMGMNLDSGELLAVKQVLIGTNSASKEKAQAHIRELEEEVKLLKNLSHPNIVRYLGTTREEETLNIFLEFVPGGSISSLLGKFGSFPEAVIRMYTKQLLQGLEYLHQNGIMHRDIKGANILVDNKGCIKLADFGASKQVAKLATINAAKSMKGTPYWMAPEVILQTGHSFSADIWSVGCTVIEMATGKPPWSQQYQEVAALFHIGTTKSHPPIPEHLSSEAKDFLLKCLQKEPKLRPTASDLLQHPFVTREFQDLHPIHHSDVGETSRDVALTSKLYTKSINNDGDKLDKDGNDRRSCSIVPKEFVNAKPIWELSNNSDMCQLDDTDDYPNVGSSFNPMSEPFDEWLPEKFDVNPEPHLDDSHECVIEGSCTRRGNDFAFSLDPVEDDDEVTESKIRAFLDEKALDLKKLQTPLYEEFYNSLNNKNKHSSGKKCEDNATRNPKLPPKIKMSSNKVASGTTAQLPDLADKLSPGNCSKQESRSEEEDDRILREISSQRQRKWKEELDQELEREREMLRRTTQGKTSSPKDGWFARNRDQTRHTSSGK